MAPPREHHRTQSLLLVSKLLDSAAPASPFTLITDTLSQSARPLLAHMLRRARARGARTVYAAFETLRPPRDVDAFVPAAQLAPAALRTRLAAAAAEGGGGGSGKRTVLVLDSVHALLAAGSSVAEFLAALVTPATSLVAVVHADVPLPVAAGAGGAYAAPPLALLRFLATTLLAPHSLAHVLARKAARERSVAAPAVGLDGEAEGVLVGLGSNDPRGFVLEMEHRRKSGRSVGGWYFVPSGSGGKAEVGLLEEHPLYRTVAVGGDGEGGGLEVSFNIGLTEKQRADREGVVLPYFDAQRDGGAAGPGEGGRILYDMGSEDDFDDEEDEI